MTTGHDGEPGRARLERVAFGPATTDADRQSAIAALRELDAVHTSAAELVAAIEPVAAEAAHEIERELETPVVRRRPRSRVLVLRVLVLSGVAVAAIVTAAVTAVVAGILPRSGGGAPAATTSRTVTSPRPDPTANPAAAFKLLLLNQTFEDTTYPMRQYASAEGIQPASIHAALESATGDTLWVARSESDLCMMWTSQPKDGITEGGAKCVTPRAFARDGGLRLTHNGAVWVWDGVNFTVSPG